MEAKEKGKMGAFLTDGGGKPSLGRLVVAIGTGVSTIVALSGVVGFFLRLDAAALVVGAGMGGFALGEWAKSIAKKFEMNT